MDCLRSLMCNGKKKKEYMYVYIYIDVKVDVDVDVDAKLYVHIFTGFLNIFLYDFFICFLYELYMSEEGVSRTLPGEPVTQPSGPLAWTVKG